jgi:hypothetical protein
VNLADDCAFQNKLRAEIVEQKKKKNGALNVADYAAKQDSLVHYLTLESVGLVSHVRKF